MWTVRVKDRGRDIAWHTVEGAEEAREIARVYELLGYLPERITVDPHESEVVRAAA